MRGAQGLDAAAPKGDPDRMLINAFNRRSQELQKDQVPLRAIDLLGFNYMNSIYRIEPNMSECM